MDSATIRRLFLEFFEKKNHLIVPSAPLVLKNDPTLLFTNSGMVQFKDYFLGNGTPKSKRIADTQKCLRVSGKHNDLEEVGIDTYHHTMFEMLGNWSFGDYFKKEAIEWAWELLTDVYKLPKDRLYVSVFGGDKGDNLPVDTDAIAYWKNIVPEDRIIHGKKKDNFWEMGETGPCGPCSEIHIDLRPEAEVKKTSGKELVNNDHPQVIEIWNLVFMEFNRKADGSLEKLPAQHVDTGMGFERLCMAIQGKTSTYDTTVFKPLMDFISEAAGVKYGSNEKTDIAIRVLADHIRAVAFAIADGQLPSNTGAGYVIRRILRRAVRYGYTFLNFKDPFLYKLVPILADQMKDVFPELHAQLDYVTKVIHEEEISFLKTLDRGLKRFDAIESELKNKVVPGELAFELYDTFGFPFDLTSLIAREKGFSVDEKGFQVEMQKQKERSKADAAKETGDWVLVGEDEKTEFIGYDFLEATVRIVKYRKLVQKSKELYQLVFDRTPFYAESGGQVGDTGYIQFGNEKISITDTKKENELIVHFTDKLPADLSATFHAVVNERKRKLTMNNHSVTHLLHAALREVLGKHVEQKGSLVNEKITRFDFSHFAAMTSEEIQQVEDRVNAKIREDIHADIKQNVPIDEAKKLGAMALFGEKYGDFVRVVTFDPQFSVELCGGTHVPSTGNIGLFKIISESSVAAGVRRIEAITAETAEQYVRQEINLLKDVRTSLKNPKDLIATINKLMDDNKFYQQQLSSLMLKQLVDVKNDLKAYKLQKIGDINFLASNVDPIFDNNKNADDLIKTVAFMLKNEVPNLVAILTTKNIEKAFIGVLVSDNLSTKYDARDIIKVLAKEIDGGGGGQPFFATAGGKNIAGLDAVIIKAKELIR
jgi:alanyl-tRNA synthetase